MDLNVERSKPISSLDFVDEELKIITPEDIKNSCKKNNLYTVPELNEVLYLHYDGCQKIANFDPYANVTSMA